MKRLEKIICRIFDAAVISGAGTCFAGAIFDKPVIMYSAFAGTFITALVGAYYNDTLEKKIL